MIEIVDQMNRTIRLEKFPERIVSLVPSQTELLFDLGLDEKVVGITKFCIHPDSWFKTKQRIGGTKNLNIDTIKNLKPDLIIGNKEENSQDDILLLQQLFPVYMSDIFNVTDALKMIEDVGVLTNTKDDATKMIHQIEIDFATFPTVRFVGTRLIASLQNEPTQLRPTVLYLIWANPFMAVGNNTFIGDMIRKFGLTNVLVQDDARYLELTAEKISKLNPDFLFLSSEPFPFNETHEQELRKISKAKIIHTDGELFSWYGSRMLTMKTYFTQLALRL